MIHYVVTKGNEHTILEWLDDWAPSLAGRVRIRTYQDLCRSIPDVAGTWVFSDIIRLGPARRRLATKVWQQLERLGRLGHPIVLLNHPTRSLDRMGLLRVLYRMGINDYRIWSARQWATRRGPVRYPVFVRNAGDHRGALGDLLYDAAAVRRALALSWAVGTPARQLMIAEFTDSREADGLHRKYSAFLIDGCVVPRELTASQRWVVKRIDRVTPELLAEQAEWFESHNHDAQLLQIGRAAHIDYGRVDYCVTNGRIQVFEINTNPVIMRRRTDYTDATMAHQRRFAARILTAFEDLDQKAQGGGTGSSSPTPTLRPSALGAAGVLAERTADRAREAFAWRARRALDARRSR